MGGDWRRREKLVGMRGRRRMRRMLGTGHGRARARRVRARGRRRRRLRRQPRRLAGRARLLPRDQGRHARAHARSCASSTRRRTCRSNERSLAWNLRGPPGPAGPPGAGRPCRPRRARGPRRPARPARRRRLRSRAPHRRGGAGLRDVAARCAPPPLCNDDGFEPNDTHRPGHAGRSRHDHLRHGLRRATTTTSRSPAAGGVVTASLDVRLHGRARGRAARRLGRGARERGGQQPAERQHARRR